MVCGLEFFLSQPQRLDSYWKRSPPESGRSVSLDPSYTSYFILSDSKSLIHLLPRLFFQYHTTIVSPSPIQDTALDVVGIGVHRSCRYFYYIKEDVMN